MGGGVTTKYEYGVVVSGYFPIAPVLYVSSWPDGVPNRCLGIGLSFRIHWSSHTPPPYLL